MGTQQKIKKMCKRCNRNFTKDTICSSCKIELVNLYDTRLDWQTAYEIETVQRSTFRFLSEDF